MIFWGLAVVAVLVAILLLRSQALASASAKFIGEWEWDGHGDCLGALTELTLGNGGNGTMETRGLFSNDKMPIRWKATGSNRITLINVVGQPVRQIVLMSPNEICDGTTKLYRK